MNKTVIISCAGMGRRLGIGCTKALIDIDGKPLIIRHLEALKEIDDIRIVVGYQAEKVISIVRKYRDDVTFVFNHNYMNNGTAASVSLASKNANEYILTLDGDTIIHPNDLKEIVQQENEFIGVCKPGTDNPVLVTLDENEEVIAFSRDKGSYEWTGIMQIKKERLAYGDGHVYQLIDNLLPLPSLNIRLKEIDTLNDFEKAKYWVKNGYMDLPTIGIVGGMGSYATLDYFKRILDAFPAEKEWERPRIIIDNYCTMPSRVRAILYDEQKEELIDSLTTSIKNLINSGATKIILACNTSHVFLPFIYDKFPTSKSYIINIIDECFKKALNSKHIDNMLLLASEGTIDSGVYQNNFNKYGYNLITPQKKDIEQLRIFIEYVKQNQLDNDKINEFIKYINQFEQESIILGCTELPVIYSLCKNKINKEIIDPLECSISILKDDINIYK